jgi:hypothetical protein
MKAIHNPPLTMTAMATRSPRVSLDGAPTA